MPVTVDIPDVGEVEFPDSMSQEAINFASGQLYGQRQRALGTPAGKSFVSYEEALQGITGPARIEPQRVLSPSQPGQLGPAVLPPHSGGAVPGFREDLPLEGYLSLLFDPKAMGLPGFRRIDPNRYQELYGKPPSTALRVSDAIYNATFPFVESLYSLGGVGSLGVGSLGGLPARTVAGGFALETGRHLPEQAVDFYEALKLDLPLEQQVERGLTLGGGALFTGLLGTGAARGGFEGLTRPVSPRELGDYRPLPDPDLIARNVAAPGTLRPQEISLWSAPDVEFPPETFRVGPGVPIVNVRGEVIDVRSAEPTRPQIERPTIIPVTRGAVREAPPGGRLETSGREFESVGARPGALLSAEERLIRQRVTGTGRERGREEYPELEASGLQDVAQKLESALQQRDLTQAVQLLAKEPAQAQAALINAVIGVRQRVRLSAGERIIFNEIWEKAVEESRKQRPAQPAQAPGLTPGQIFVREQIEASRALEAYKAEQRAAATAGAPAPASAPPELPPAEEIAERILQVRKAIEETPSPQPSPPVGERERLAARPADAIEVPKAEPPSQPGQPPPVSAERAKPVKRVGLGLAARTRFERETQAGAQDILAFIADEYGGLISKTQARTSRGAEWWERNKSLYDDAVTLAAPHHNVIYSTSGGYPDQIAQAAYDAGRLRSPDVNELWTEIHAASRARVNLTKDLAREKRVMDQWVAEAEAWSKATAKGEQRVRPEELRVGDLMEVEGERVKVTAINADTGDVTLDDGRKFGTQTVRKGQTIAVEKYQPAEGGATFEPGELREGAARPPNSEAWRYTRAEWDAMGGNPFWHRLEVGRNVGREAIRPEVLADYPEYSGVARPAPAFRLESPENVVEQRARLEAESRAQAAAEQRRQIEEGAARPLTGTAGDIGQGELFGEGGDLFSLREGAEPGNRGQVAKLNNQDIVNLFNNPAVSEASRLMLASEAAQRGLDPATGRDVGLPRAGASFQFPVPISELPPAAPGAVRGRKLAAAPRRVAVAGGGAGRPAAPVVQRGAAEARAVAREVQLSQLRPGDSVTIGGVPLTVEWFRRDPGLKHQGTLRVRAPDGRWAELRKDARERIVATRTRSLAPTGGEGRGEGASVKKPGIISGTPAEAWANRVIQESQLRLFAGIDPELMAAYVVKGAALFERGTRRFVDWSGRMIAEFGDAIRPHLREIFSEAQRTLTQLGADEKGRRILRKLSERAAVSPEIPEPTQARILSDPASYHERQNIGRVKDRVAGMSNSELVATPLVQPSGPENFGVAARLELMKRAFASGEDEAAYGILRELSAQLTSFGQLVNQAKMLQGIAPEYILKMVDAKLGQAGQPQLRPTERIRIMEAARESIKANMAWEQAERDWVKSPKDSTFRRVFILRQRAIKSDLAVQRLIHDVNPRTLPDMLLAIEQGNVMAPISQAANVGGNMTFLQLEQGSRTIGTGFDVVDHFLTGRPRELTVSPIRGTAAVAAATARAVPKAIESLWKGTSDWEVKGEARQPLRPFVAWRDLILAALGRGPEPLRQKGLRLLEASPMAMHAAAQLRLLAAGDVMFRSPAEARLINEAMKLEGMNRRNRIRLLERGGTHEPGVAEELAYLRAQERDAGKNAKRAQAMPELFLSPEELGRINREAKAAVFQQPNAISRWLMGGLAQAPPWLRFGLRQIALFIQTPVNLIGRVLAYNPIGALIETARYLKAGDRRSAKIAAGRFVLGSMMYGTGAYLASRGLIAPTQSEPDTQQKERLAAGQVFPPGHVNLSGIERLMKGEDPTWRAGDQTRSLLRVGGGGLLLLNGSDLHYSLAEKAAERTTASEALGQFGLKTLSQTGGYAIQQSFLKGTASMLDALVKGEFDKWFQSMAEGLTAIPLPNTLTAMARAGREFKPEIRGDSMAGTLENIFRNRLGAFGGAEDELPFKRDLWGRPLRETPEGNWPWVYQMLDVTKAQRIPDDSPDLQLYSLWRRTGDAAVWPTPPSRTLQVANRNYRLTRAQESRLQERVGRTRRRLIEALTANPNWLNAPDDAKIEVLARAYSEAHTAEKFVFWARHWREFQTKPKPAGFR